MSLSLPKMMGVVSSQGGAASTFILDEFNTVTDNVSINGRTPSPNTLGNNWVVSLGGIKGFGTTAVRGNLSGAENHAYIDTGMANCVITCDFTKTNNRGILYRRSGTGSYFLVIFASNALQIYEWSGSFTLRATSTGASVTDGTITLTLNGNSHTAVSGGQTATYSTATGNTATQHGIRLYDNLNTAAADNWKCEPL